MAKFDIKKREKRIKELSEEKCQLSNEALPIAKKIASIDSEIKEIQNEIYEYAMPKIDDLIGKIYGIKQLTANLYLKIKYIESANDDYCHSTKLWYLYGDGFIIGENRIEKVLYDDRDTIKCRAIVNASDICKLEEISYEDVVKVVNETFSKIIKKDF